MQKNACLSCRVSKLRCSLDTFAEHNKCRRCFNTNHECVFKTVAPRQRRKRTDTRVTALEQRLAELHASIEAAHTAAGTNAQVPRPAPQPTVGTTAHLHGIEALVEERKWIPREDGKLVDNCHLQSTLETLLASGQLSTSTAVDLFHDFINNVLPQYPIVSFSSTESFSWLRRHQPTLLLATITAACRASDPSLFRRLHSHLRGDLSEQVMVQGNRSVELVQAIVVMVEWYDSPDDMRHLNFYTWIQVASVMVRELGLWPWGEEVVGVEHTVTAAEWRTAFAAYLTMSIAAVSLRRPMSTVWTDSTRKGLDAFDKNSMHEHDKRLVAWVRLQMIAEEAETLRIKASSSLAPAEVSSPVDQHTLSSLESRFGRWRDAAQPVLNGSLRMHFFYCRLKFYELAVTCSPARPASPRETQPPALAAAARDMAYTRAIMSLIQSSHSALDTLVLFDVATYRRCPTTTSIRALYALQEIITVWKSIHHDHQQQQQQQQGGYLAELVNEEALALIFYARQTEEFFKKAAGAEGFVVPQMALNALANVLPSLGDVKSHKRRSRMQPPETFGQVSVKQQQQEATKTPHRMINDLEVILVIDLGSIQTPSNQEQERDQAQDQYRDRDDPSRRSEATAEWSALCASNGEGFDVTLGHVLFAPDLEAMALPGAVIDPGWLFSESR
ncbi:hypothetical protein J3F83DRAFT_730905 [Trichoderma novae-zelandiae]